MILTPFLQLGQARFGDGAATKTTLSSLNSALSAGRNNSSIAAPVNKKQQSTSTTEEQFIGENQNLEKPYLRLTTFPRKEDVRPLAVLQKSLQHIKKRYKETEDFSWSNEQLKSVRQDITVQGIRNAFVLEVYETHSRILLEHGDLNEFNQCQTMIRSLTDGTFLDDDASSLNFADASSSPKSKRKRKKQLSCKPLQQSPALADEFGAYACLYAVVQRSWMSLKMELMRIQPILALGDDKASSCNQACRHAVEVADAVACNNYRRFFFLYDTAPHMSVYLMDFMLQRVRISAYERIVAAFRPTIGVRQIQEWMGFLDQQETKTFLQARSAVFLQQEEDEKGGDDELLDCKACCKATS